MILSITHNKKSHIQLNKKFKLKRLKICHIYNNSPFQNSIITLISKKIYLTFQKKISHCVTKIFKLKLTMRMNSHKLHKDSFIMTHCKNEIHLLMLVVHCVYLKIEWISLCKLIWIIIRGSKNKLNINSILIHSQMKRIK